MPNKPGSRVRTYAWQSAPRPKGQEARGRLREYYKTARWTRESSAFRRDHPLCEECKRNGIITPSQVTDHILPPPIVDFWDRSNWQALCKACNNAKGNKDKQLLNKTK